MDESHNRGRLGDIVFMTGVDSIKAKNIQRDNRVSICVGMIKHRLFPLWRYLI
ncbi:MAG: hypothetical protein ACRD4J_09230 [Nitrososphaeraceae archaeon]